MKIQRRGFLTSLAGFLGMGSVAKAVELAEDVSPLGAEMVNGLEEFHQALKPGLTLDESAAAAGWVRHDVTWDGPEFPQSFSTFAYSKTTKGKHPGDKA